MRIRIITLAAFLWLFSGCGTLQNMGGIKGSGNLRSETRSLSGFKKIDAGGAIKLDVSVGKEFSVVVEADDNLLSHVITEVRGDTLSIGSNERISPSKQVNVTISLPEFVDLDLSGASVGNVTGVKGDDLDMTATGASKIRVAGETKDLDLNASGASNIDAEGLKAENAKAEASGASTITINAAGKADLNASGASTVIYVGEPKELKQNSSGASSIKKK